MSFRFSPGTMESMAGVFAPPKKYRLGAGGGSPKAPKAGGTILGFAVAWMFPKPAASGGTLRPSYQAKAAFGGGPQVRMSGRAVMTAERTARRVPEAVVRVTGRQHGGGHVLANFAYISRLGHGDGKELGLETSEGDVLRDGRDLQELAKEWHDYEMDGDARRKGATSISMILSMPTGTDPERLKSAALDFAREEFANRSWVASLHTDRDHPHVHLTIARRDHDGRRFHPNRDDLFRYRQRFAEKLRGRGIEANANSANQFNGEVPGDAIAILAGFVGFEERSCEQRSLVRLGQMCVLAPEIGRARDDIVEVGAQEGSEQADPILIGRHLGEQSGRHRRQTSKLVGTGREQFDRDNRPQAVICPRQPLK